MGEYSRLNKMLRKNEQRYKELENKTSKSEEDILDMVDLCQSIGEIKVALLVMAEMDGYEDIYAALDYYE